MKSLIYLGSFSLIAAILTMVTMPADAAPKKVFVPKNGNTGTFKTIPTKTIPTKTIPTKTDKAGGGTGGQAKAGDVTAKGGNGGDATGKGAKGGNGGDAIAVSGNNNTVINGDNNTIIKKQVNNNISLNLPGGGIGGGGSGGGGGGGFSGGSDGGFAAPAPIVEPAPVPEVAPAGDEPEREQIFTRRLLKVKNDSAEPIKMFVQFRGMEDKKWTWVPADPNESQDALVFELKPGQESYLVHKGQRVAGSRVRIWGVSEKSSWLDYRDQDLWIVPEIDTRGEHRYQATEMRTFTFVFPSKAAAK